MTSKPGKRQQGNPAGCAGEGKQSKGNIGKEKRAVGAEKYTILITS